MKNNKYQEAGVNIEAGYESVELIKKHVAATNNLGTVASIGGFGALFDFQKYNYQNPMLVAGTDGVGTKLEIAKELEVFDTIGIDLVAMCVNDIVTIGAKPLFFLDYIAIDINKPEKIEQLVQGICTGLKMCDCALIGGETAEMPGVYHKDGFDLAGFVTGIVEKEAIIKTDEIKPGQIIIGLPSSGIHSNGYSLVRKIVKDNNLNLKTKYPELDNEKTLGEVLLTPTKIYVEEILSLIEKVDVKGLVHVTGGGFYENVKRITKEYGATFTMNENDNLPIYDFLQNFGDLDYQEMFGYFNMGIGMMIIVEQEAVDQTLSLLANARVIGEVTNAKEIEIC